MKKKRFLSDSDAHYVVKDAEKILAPDRRRLLQQGLTLGGIMMLTGCDISNNDDIEKALFRISRFNDRIQSFLFSKNSVAPEYLPEDITTPFPFNAFYGEEEIPVIDGQDYKLEIRGLVRDNRNWFLSELYNMQHVNRPGFPGECFICELRLPDHRFRWKHNKLFLLLPVGYGPAFPAIVDCYTSPPT